MDFLELFDAIVRKTKLVLDNYAPATTMDARLADLGLDSLDYMMIFMELGDMHGIPGDIADNPPDIITVQDVKNFIDKHKVRDFESVAEAMGSVR